MKRHTGAAAGRRAFGRRFGKTAAMVCLAGASTALADSGRASGDIVGNFALSGFTADSFRIEVLDTDDDGASATSSVSSGTRFDLSIEGDQTYESAVGTLQYPDASVRLTATELAIGVTSGATTTLDDSVLVSPGGSIHVTPTVSGGSLVSASYIASAVLSRGARYEYTARSRASTFPMAAAADVAISGSAQVVVQGEDGAPLCTAPAFIPEAHVAVAAGTTTDVAVSISVDPSFCQTGFGGRLALRGIDADDVTFWSVESLLHSEPDVQAFASANGNDADYDLVGLTPDSYDVFATADLLSGEDYTFHTRGPFSLTDGQRTAVDFADDAAFATGSVHVSGATPSNAFVAFQRDDGDAAQIPLLGDAYRILLAPGQPAAPWRRSSEHVTFSSKIALDGCAARTSSSFVTVFDGSSEGKSVSAAADTDFGAKQIAASAGRTSLSMTPPTPFDFPEIVATRVDPATGDLVQIISAPSLLNTIHPSVSFVGPPGRYAAEAFATVDDEQVRFATPTIDLGAATATPQGDHVVVNVLDSAGHPLNVKLTFEHVTSAGATTATASDLGPAVPDPLRAARNAFAGLEYLDLSTTAAFTGKVEVCVGFDLDALSGLDPSDVTAIRSGQRRLHAEDFTCSTCGGCAFEDVDENYSDPASPRFFPGGAEPPRDAARCSVVTDLSRILLAVDESDPPTAAADEQCVGRSGAPALVSTDPGACVATADNASRRIGGCSDAGGGLASCTFDGQASESLATGDHTVVVEGVNASHDKSSCSSFVSVVDEEPPVVTCAPRTVECQGTRTLAEISAACSDNCGACDATCGSGPFVMGSNTSQCNAVDGAQNTGSCRAAVEVVDTQPPFLTVSAAPSVLSPADGRLVAITVFKNVGDVCDLAPTSSCAVTSSDGATTGPHDIVMKNGRLFLRAAESAPSKDRVYTITCTARDASGNTKTASTQVTVSCAAPH